MKSLIIPDIHNQTRVVDRIVEAFSDCDQVELTGDYFDSPGDSPEMSRATAEWVKERLSRDNWSLLMGNHDISYRHTSYCSGFTPDKQRAISSVLSPADWEGVKTVRAIGPGRRVLLSHAGVSSRLIETFLKRGLWDPELFPIANLDPDALHLALHTTALKANRDMELHARDDLPLIYDVSYFRGGRGPVAGVTWCDFEEFVPLKGLFQIFGHTRGKGPRVKIHGANSAFLPEGGTPDPAPGYGSARTLEAAAFGFGLCQDCSLHTVSTLDDSGLLQVWRLSFSGTPGTGEYYYDRHLERVQPIWSINLPTK